MSKGKQLAGQDFDVDLSFPIIYKQQMIDDLSSISSGQFPNTDVQPNDAASALKREYDFEATRTGALDVWRSMPIYVDIPLDPTLTSLSLVFSETFGEGASQTIAQNTTGVGSSVNFVKDPNNSARSSVAIMAELVPVFRKNSKTRYPAQKYEFFIDENQTLEDLISRLEIIADVGTILPWPQFKPQSHTFIITGQEKSITASAKTVRTINLSADSTNISSDLEAGYSVDVGQTIKAVQLDYALHGALTITPSSQSKAITVAVSANVEEVEYTLNGVPGEIPEVVNAPGALTLTATASVTPTTLTATSPSDVPSSGSYLFDFDCRSVGYGLQRVTAIVVDMSL